MASLKERTGVKTDSSLDRWLGSQGKWRMPGSQAATALQRVCSKTIPSSIHLLIPPPHHHHWVWGGRSTQRIPLTYCVFLDCGKSGKPQYGWKLLPPTYENGVSKSDLTCHRAANQSCQSELPDGAGNPKYHFGCSDLE